MLTLIYFLNNIFYVNILLVATTNILIIHMFENIMKDSLASIRPILKILERLILNDVQLLDLERR